MPMTTGRADDGTASHDDRTHRRPFRFAYWEPNVSSGLVTSDIEQRTDWNYEYDAKLAQTAERVAA